MTAHKTGTHEEWRAARLELLEAEKAHTRRSDELARQRHELPWVPIEKEYRFDTDEGAASLADLFRGRSQLLVYHFMFGPQYTAGCPSCSAIADGFDGSVVHLANHDVSLYAVSRAPLAKLQSYKRRMGWKFPWASSFGSDFNYDFHVSHTEDEWRAGAVEYNFRPVDFRPAEESPALAEWASRTGTDFATYRREGPGVSAFALQDGVVHLTYSAYERGVDALWGMYAWLDRAPLGRNETGFWWQRHDEYARETLGRMTVVIIGAGAEIGVAPISAPSGFLVWRLTLAAGLALSRSQSGDHQPQARSRLDHRHLSAHHTAEVTGRLEPRESSAASAAHGRTVTEPGR